MAGFLSLHEWLGGGNNEPGLKPPPRIGQSHTIE